MSAAAVGMLLGSAVYRLDSRSADKTTLRKRHAGLMGGAFVCMVTGLSAIVLNKIRIGKSVVPHTLHATLGALAVMLVMAQVTVGVLKYRQASLGNSVHKWHGKAGPVIAVFFALAASTGVWESAIFESSKAILALVSAFLILSVFVTRANVPFPVASYDSLPVDPHSPPRMQVDVDEAWSAKVELEDTSLDPVEL